MTKQQKSWLLIAQICISVGILAWLFFRIEDDLDNLFGEWNKWTPFWMAAGLCFTLLSFAFATLRWRQVGLALHINEPGRKMFSHFMSGQFVSNFLPTSVGGDVVRVTRLSMDTGRPRESFASVVLDRFCGWPILGAISLVGFAVNPGTFSDGGFTAITAILISGGTIIIFLVAAYIATHETIGNKLKNLGGLWRYINALHIGLNALKSDKKHALQVVGASVAMQTCAILAASCAAEALNINEVGGSVVMAYLPPILIIQILPISIGGFGIRETSFTVALSTIGVQDFQAVEFGLLLGFMNIIVSLIGAPALAFGGLRKAKKKSGLASGNMSAVSPQNKTFAPDKSEKKT